MRALLRRRGALRCSGAVLGGLSVSAVLHQKGFASSANEGSGGSEEKSFVDKVRSRVFSALPERQKSKGFAADKDRTEAGFFERLQDRFSEGSDDFFQSFGNVAGIASSMKGLITGATKGEEGIEKVIEQSQSALNAGEFQKQRSYSEILDLFQEMQGKISEQLSNAFGEVDIAEFRPSALWYYLELEDEIKNPSWKRRKHRFMSGANIKEVKKIFENLKIAEISYLDSKSEIENALPQVLADENEHIDLLFCSVNSNPGEPAHFVALKRPSSILKSPVLVISVRGTKTVGDVFTDALLEPESYRGGLAHHGMVQSARWLVNLHKDLIEKVKKTSPGLKIEIVGHSLGAISFISFLRLSFCSLTIKIQKLSRHCDPLWSGIK